MRRIGIGSFAFGVLALMTYGCTSTRGMQPPEHKPLKTSEALLNGTGAGNDSGTVALFLDGYTRVCSGTLLNPQWIITSSNCLPADGGNDVWVQDANTSGAPASRIVHNDALNVALVRINTPISITPSVRPLYNGVIGALMGKTLTAYGAGNGSTTDPAPNPNDIGLRYGMFTLSPRAGSPDTYNVTGTGGVQLVAGDEGGGTVYSDGTQSYLLGIHVKDSAGNFYDVSSLRFHDWVEEQMYGVVSYTDAFTRDASDGLLVSNYQDTKTWSPCGTGSYSWSATYDFGIDASGTIAAGGTTQSLTGQGNASGRGTGAMTLGVTTSANQVWGLTSLSATCDALSLTCAGTECVSSATNVPSQKQTATWAPCGATGCFAWGATMNGTQSGDSISVAGQSVTSSVAATSNTALDACGSVQVAVNVGAAAGTRNEMDVFAVCGCDDKAHICAPSSDNRQRCGTPTNACGMTFNCGACQAGAICDTNSYCACPTGWVKRSDAACYRDVCAVNNGGCSSDATCTNDTSPGGNGRSCQCHAGYRGDGVSCSRDPNARMNTNVGPAVATTPDGVLFIAADEDNRIYTNRVVLGGAGGGWLEVGGNGRTDAAPAGALVGNNPYVFLAVKGLDNNLYINQGGLGGGWVGWLNGGISTSYAPAVTQTPDGVLFSVVDGNGHTRVQRVVLGGAGGPWFDVGGVATAAPALAVCGNSPYVFAVVRGQNGHLWLNQTSLANIGGRWIGWGDTGFTTPYAPAMAQTPDGVIIFAVGTNGHTYFSRIVLGQAMQSWVDIGGVSNASPGAALVGNNPYIFAAVKGMDSTVYINQAGLGGGWVGWR